MGVCGTCGRDIRAVTYGRLSDEGGRSVERQAKICARVATEHGWELVDTLQEWVPASLLGRPPSKASKKYRKEWAELVAGVRVHQWCAIIFWMADRSARHTVYGLELVNACKTGGVTQVEIAGRIYNFTDPVDEAAYMGEVAGAQQEVARSAKRIRAAKQELAEDGHLHTGGMRAFGFTGSGKQQVPLHRALAEQDCIAQALHRVVAGDSLRGIVSDWNGAPDANGKLTKTPIPSANGSQWTTRTLRRMLLSPRLVGDRVHCIYRIVDDKRVLVSETVYPGDAPAIVDRQLWETARAILGDATRMVNAVGGTPRYHLTGILFCGICGARMRGEQRDGAQTYVCPSRSGGGRRCTQRLAKDVDDLVFRALFQAVESDDFQQAVQGMRADDPTNQYRERLTQLTADIDTYTDMETEADRDERQARKLDDDRKLTDARRKLASIRRKLGQAESEHERTWAAIERLSGDRVTAHVPRNVREVWPRLSLDRRRAILAAVFRGYRLEVHRQGRGRNFDPSAVTIVPVQ
jgi:DNA invertase Pin-like site-specific DNA recombinase